MKKQWKRLAALSSAAVMAAGTLLYFPTDSLTWTLTADGTMTISGTGAMKAYGADGSPATQKKANVKKL